MSDFTRHSPSGTHLYSNTVRFIYLITWKTNSCQHSSSSGWRNSDEICWVGNSKEVLGSKDQFWVGPFLGSKDQYNDWVSWWFWTRRWEDKSWVRMVTNKGMVRPHVNWKRRCLDIFVAAECPVYLVSHMMAEWPCFVLFSHSHGVASSG